MTPCVDTFFDPATWTASHVVHAGPGSACAIIDPVMDYDAKAGRTSLASAGKIMDFVRSHDLSVQWILETHAHADHLSAAAYLKSVLGGQVAIGAGITQVQQAFGNILHLDAGFARDGSQFDHLLRDNETFAIGALEATALAVPGHTPACMAYRVGDAVFVGDTLFMPDVGTARCDFPGGDAVALYRSVRRLLDLPAATRLFMCHDYPPQGRAFAWESTVAAQRSGNIHLHDGVTEQDFVKMRSARDATLDMPALILPSVQVNIRAGNFPAPEANGVSYLKVPLNLL